ncbi:MAG TPA: hypothetical protein VF768_06080 [Holophagaceae bacterium]
MIVSMLETFAKEHPAFVHVPLGLVATLPLAMLASIPSKAPHRWTRTSFFIALVALLGSGVAILSGLLWGRQIALIPGRGFFPVVAGEKQVLQRILQLHELGALGGFLLGCVCVGLLGRAWYRDHLTGATASQNRRHGGRRFWERGVGLPALAVGLMWLGAWGFCGKLGGVMVFGNDETNRAAAAALEAKRVDAEAEVPVRALDYASLEPAVAAPMRIKAHGSDWSRIWVTASGIDAYQAGKPMEPGAYAVVSTTLDQHGKPGQDPGPLYFLEITAEGQPKFAFYWPRVPDSRQAEVGGSDSVYWRSPDPHLKACLACHARGPARLSGPAARP